MLFKHIILYFILMLSWLVVLPANATAYAANPDKKNKPAGKFQNSTIRQIYTYQNERNTKGLVRLLRSKKAMYRKEAALALGSVQDTNAIRPLVALLYNKEFEVRAAAAYALGQIGSTEVESKLIEASVKEKNPTVLSALFHAIGKCSTERGLHYLETQHSEFEEVHAATIRGLYNAGLRGFVSDLSIRKAAESLDIIHSDAIRREAAYYLGRHSTGDLSIYFEPIAWASQLDQLAEVRVHATQALARIGDTTEVVEVLTNIIMNDPDSRVRVSALKAARTKDVKLIREAAEQALQNPNPNVSVSAAEYFLSIPSLPKGADSMEEIAQLPNWRTRTTLLKGMLQKSASKPQVSKQIVHIYEQSNNVYEQAFLLSALALDAGNYAFLAKEAFDSEHPAIKANAMEALVYIRKNKDFPLMLSGEFKDIFRKAIESGDAAMMTIAAEAIGSPELNFTKQQVDPRFLMAARDKLLLPRDIETYQAVQQAINYLAGQPLPGSMPKMKYTPLIWDKVNAISTTQKVKFETNKGDIVMQLMVEQAPASVLSFLSLIEEGYYTNKVFHRVVPNFVVQGGCPRGDGYGGHEWALRSELPPAHYGEGYVGLASAGRDTESSQWFITHTAAPHLDGRYTIFARVVSGMDIVNELEIGDSIIKAEMIK
jgi:cyclophilin family peptidyl-prolyl cis-trans isomerase/HEAT repeat protein